MTIPVVYGVCASNPDTQFVYVTKKPVAALFVGAPKNLTVVGADLKGKYRGHLGPLRLIRDLHREYHFDAVADLHSVLRTHLMDLYCVVHRVPVVRIDKMRRERQELVSRGAMHAPALEAMIKRYEEVFVRLGLNAPSDIEAPVVGTIDPMTTAHIMPPRAEGETWISVAPFAAHRGKIYPVECMKQVVEAIAKRPSTRVILFGGGGDEARLLDSWAAEIPGVVSVAGKKYGFTAELGLMAQCSVMVSMDSANMHLASLMGVPVVSIWGATHPAAGFVGWRQDEANIVDAPLACRPCSIFGDRVCHRGTYECMDAITPQEITARIVNLLNETNS